LLFLVFFHFEGKEVVGAVSKGGAHIFEGVFVEPGSFGDGKPRNAFSDRTGNLFVVFYALALFIGKLVFFDETLHFVLATTVDRSAIVGFFLFVPVEDIGGGFGFVASL
jgi:hypothetical protein